MERALSALLPLLASAAAYSPRPAAAEEHESTFRSFINLIQTESAAAQYPTDEQPGMLHTLGRSAIVVLTATVEATQGLPSYLLACLMVLGVVLTFALLWCVPVALSFFYCAFPLFVTARCSSLARPW